MFFYLSKILWIIVSPLNLITILVTLSAILIWLGRARSGKWLLAAAIIPFCLVQVLPIGDAMLLALEQRFKPVHSFPEKVDGIILVGGAQMPLLTKAYGIPAMNGAGETVTTFLALAKKYPSAKLVFSGGTGDIFSQGITEADTVKLFLTQQGFDANKLIYETKSRNTYENALYSKQLAKPRPGEQWLLVVTAAGAPRAVGVFRKLDWPVTPIPADFTVLPRLILIPSLSVTQNFLRLEMALHEWIGLAAYFFTGKTSELFPGP